MSLNKGQKLVKMVQLMNRAGGVRAGELMSRFDLDARTLRRYLADLRELGLPVEDDGRAEDRSLSIDARWRRTGVQLSLAEVLSLHFGRKLFDFLEGTSFASDLDGAIERLEPAISRAHQDLARQLDKKFLAVPEHHKHYAGAASEVIDEVITALVYSNPVDARYRKASGVEKRVQLHPYTLATFRQGLYLFARDVEAGGIKTYALERFTDLRRRRRERFDYPRAWDPEAQLRNAFGIIDGPSSEVVIAFTEAVAPYIRERTWHYSQVFGTLPDGRLELRMQVAPTVEVETWVLGFGADAQVLGPPELVSRIRAKLEAAVQRYESAE